ncbi:MAG TPA: Rieske 2Fe-2S domain-containing protein [Candidatus Limnocylindria bacterium]|nr:Rieske 2Fe-2S domain-containing protein [Candidatus Limnocylindria bacterium]
MSRPLFLHRLLVACYPARWRERYGDELLQVLADRRTGWRDLPNLAGGVVDAWLHRRLWPAPASGVTQLAVAGPGPVASLPAVPAVPAVTASMPAAPPIGVIATAPPAGEMSRRRFLRRMLAAGTGLVLLEFGAGTLAFLWPQIREGLGARFKVGTIDAVLTAEPRFANGWPFAYNPARVFLVNVPAAKQLALGNQVSMPNPAAADLLALWRKCPHLGCLVPEPCPSTHRIQCRCHQSTYNIIGEKMKVGPAERGLDRFAVLIEGDGTIVIDTAQYTQGPPNLGPEHLAFSDPYPWDATCGLE